MSSSIIKFVPSPSYFTQVRERNGEYKATFNQGPQNSRLVRKVPLPMFGGRLNEITSFLMSTSTIFNICTRRNWDTASMLKNVEGLMVPYRGAERTWRDLVSI